MNLNTLSGYYELQTEAVIYHKFRLSQALEGLVDYCWSITNIGHTPQSTPDIHIPDGLMEVVFILEGTYEKQQVRPAARSAATVTGSCVIGLQTESHLVKGLGKMRMVGIKFTASGFARFFSHRVYASRNEEIPLNDFGEKWLLELQEKIEPMKRIEAIAQVITETLSEVLRSKEPASSLIVSVNCLSTIIARKGCLTVEELSATHHKSVRQIQRYFREHFDVSPKEYINIIRFKNLYQDCIIKQYLPHRFLDYGYFDQAHFIHDFRRRTGVAPTQAVRADFSVKNRIAAVNLGF